MRHLRITAIGALMTFAATLGARAADGPADRFVSRLEEFKDLPPQARELIRTSWANCVDCDGAEFLMQGLVLLSPKFRDAIDAYESDQYEHCATLMADLRADANPFVASSAAAYEIKALAAMEHTEEAGARIAQLTAQGYDDVDAYGYHGDEIAFLRGFCLLSDLQYDEAESAMKQFLTDRSDAPQRLIISAQQMLAELSNRQPGRIGEVVDLMHYSGRRLTLADSGETLQGRQQRIIDLLDRLIEEAQEQEKNSCSGSSSSSGGSRSQSPKKPMQQSQLPGGSAADGALRDMRRANPADMWGAMPPAERERILQSLRESFPSRYRQLVEQYYEELAKKP